MTTQIHAAYWAHSLLLAHPHDRVEILAHSIGNARVDLNPHQIDAALFALRSPFSRGVLLADEVGLGKTIEATLIVAQRWAERRRRVLLIVPATLRKQWQLELETKFFLPSVILESKSLNDQIKKGVSNPFIQSDKIVISSYQFAYSKRDLVRQIEWDLVVIDEAHRLRSIYKGTKTAEGIVDAIRSSRKLLLTATPLQNSLLELYGLISIVDPELFGSQEAFQAQFMSGEDPEERDAALRERIQHVCKRTLRRQVLEYIKFTERFTHTADFVPSVDEEKLYNEVSDYLQREVLVALPNARRKLITLVLRKLLASSSAAIGATLSKFVERLSKPKQTTLPIDETLAEDFDTLNEVEDEWDENEEPTAEVVNPAVAKAELADLERFVVLAKSVQRDSKATKLIEALPVAFSLAEGKGAPRKAVLFTESRKTQEYLLHLLSENGYSGQIVLMNGTNNDDVSKRIYAEWKARNEHRWADVSSGSKSADMKAAIVEEFRDRAAILLATESAAEGVNLQFCSIVINYDLPWNPQRIEQRIGRCHRYGQKSDVLVVNFLNRRNAADQRVFELLSEKFRLFEGVFGASDDVLGVVESGVDLEKSIASIYQDCRTPSQIQVAFDALQAQLDEKIRAGLASARRAFLENFDDEVHARLHLHRETAKESLDTQQQMLLDLAKYALRERATFERTEPRFRVTDPAARENSFHLDWQRAEAHGDIFFRLDHPLAQQLIRAAAIEEPRASEVLFVYSAHASALEHYVGKSGWLQVSKLSTEVVGRPEEYLLVAAVDDAGVRLQPDVAAKLFSLVGDFRGYLAEDPPGELPVIRDELKALYVADVETRNEELFEEEADKIGRRSEDLKLGLEQEIKKLDKLITVQTRDARKTKGLQQKLAAQKAVRDLEHRRDLKRRQYFEEQDRIKAEQETLIQRLEKQIREKRVELRTLLTTRWRLVASRSALDIVESSKGGLFKTAAEVDEYIRKERDSWER